MMNFTDKSYAIIGASNDTDKYGNKVFKDLQSAGYTVIPINPKQTEIEGVKAYKKVTEVPEKIDVAVLVVPPKVSLAVLPEIKEKGIKEVWFQPGSESDEAILYCTKNKIQATHNMCIMVMRKEEQ